MPKIVLIQVLFFFLSLIFAAPRVSAASSTLKCSPSTGTYKVGDSFTVEYILDTQNFEAFGADVTATYDPGVIQAATTASTPVITSTNWSDPGQNSIDNSLGKIELIYGNSQSAYTGSASIGSVSFRAAN